MNDVVDTYNRKIFHAGEIILTEGEVGDGAYLLQSGRVEVFTKIDGKKMHIAFVGKEEVIGESALIDNFPRSASVEAVETTVCIFIDQSLFAAKMKSADPFLRALLRVFVARQRNMISVIRNSV